jgi:hypothetical protein
LWAGIVDDVFIGLHVLSQRLTGNSYSNFLKKYLSTLSLAMKTRMWFMHDGAPPHINITIWELLDMYPARCVGRGGPAARPPCSPDLNPVDFYLSGRKNSSLRDASE